MEILALRRSPIGKHNQLSEPASPGFIPHEEEQKTYAIRELAAAKDIKLKVVKKILFGSRFSIYFQLHFPTFSWVFFANVFFSASATKKSPSEPEPGSWLVTSRTPRVCVSVSCDETSIKLFIAFRFVRFLLITILTFQLFSPLSSPLVCPTLTRPATAFLPPPLAARSAFEARKSWADESSFIGFSRFDFVFMS